jgi:hypothetical protein
MVSALPVPVRPLMMLAMSAMGNRAHAKRPDAALLNDGPPHKGCRAKPNFLVHVLCLPQLHLLKHYCSPSCTALHARVCSRRDAGSAR